METRIAVIGIIVENKDSVESVNELLHQYSRGVKLIMNSRFFFPVSSLRIKLKMLLSPSLALIHWKPFQSLSWR